MAPEPERQRYLRESEIVWITPLGDNTFSVSDAEDENAYVVTEEVLKREYTVLY